MLELSGCMKSLLKVALAIKYVCIIKPHKYYCSHRSAFFLVLSPDARCFHECSEKKPLMRKFDSLQKHAPEQEQLVWLSSVKYSVAHKCFYFTFIILIVDYIRKLCVPFGFGYRKTQIPLTFVSATGSFIILKPRHAVTPTEYLLSIAHNLSTLTHAYNNNIDVNKLG